MGSESATNTTKPGNPTDSNKNNKTIKHAESDKENRGYAAIGLGIMCLMTLMSHAILNIPHGSKPAPIPRQRRNETNPVLAFKVVSILCLLLLWAVGMTMWVTYLAKVSVTLRNRSVLGGLFAANAGLAYTLIWNSSASLQEYIACTLWPTYLGIILGVVM